MESINQRIKTLRLALNKSQEEFGKAIGLSKSAVSNIEKGERNVRDVYISAITSTFSVDSAWLKYGKGQPFLKDSVKENEAFISYLKSIGYSIQYSHSQDGEESSVTLSKQGKDVTLNDNEFMDFQTEIQNSVDYQVWIRQQGQVQIFS